MMPPDEPRVSMFRQWSIARMARLVGSLVCPKCGEANTKGREMLLELQEDGKAFCNVCGCEFIPKPESA